MDIDATVQVGGAVVVHGPPVLIPINSCMLCSNACWPENKVLSYYFLTGQREIKNKKVNTNCRQQHDPHLCKA